MLKPQSKTPGFGGPSRRVISFRCTQYKFLAAARKAAGLPALTVEELNKLTRWQIIEETLRCEKLAKKTEQLFGGEA